MSEYTTSYIPEATTTFDASVSRKSAKDIVWEDIDIGGEKFLAQRGHKNLVEVNGKNVVFSVDYYRHIESGVDIEMYSLGMDKPSKQPTIIRSDFGCPCMNYPVNFHMLAHDCSQQRSLMFSTMAELGTGAMAVVSEPTSAGNGHGKHAVHGQATMQYEAVQNGQPVPSMQKVYEQFGMDDDVRPHAMVAKLLKETIGNRPALVTTSNKDKIQEFAQAGITVIPDTRVELFTSQSLNRQSLLGRRNYDHMKGIHKEGAYLMNGHPVKLTPRVYTERFVQPQKSKRFLTPWRRPQRLN